MTAPLIILQTENLTKQVKVGEATLTILSEINLTIKAGETIAITGASGSGKSTLLSLLAGLDLPTAGRVMLRDQDLTLLDEDGRARVRAQNIGFVFQSFLLFPHLTALENVLLPLELANKNAMQTQAIELLTKVGLAKRLSHYPHQLSGGEQQRVAIARAFAANPEILFADELTGNLDRQTGLYIADILFALNNEQNTTLVLITHDENLAKRCQRILQLDNGKLI